MQKSTIDWFAVAAVACMAMAGGGIGGTLSSWYFQAQTPTGPSPTEVMNNSRLLADHAMQLRDLRNSVAASDNKRIEGDLYHLNVHSRLLGEVRCIQDHLKLPKTFTPAAPWEMHKAKPGNDVPPDGLIPKTDLPTKPIER